MITTWMILTLIFGATTIAGIYTSWNLLKKQELTEDWLVALENRLSNIIKDTKTIDEKGMFEADDEVGTIFEQINNMIKTLNDFLAK
jgi:hypothetical protein